MKRRSRLVIVCAASMLAAASGIAHAAVISFDDLSCHPTGVVPNGYAGFNWSSFSCLNALDPLYDLSGYRNGMVSAPNVVYNFGGNPAYFSSATPFDLTSAYFTGAWNDGLTVQVFGYLGATLLDNVSFVVNTNGPTLFTFNWTGIDRVLFGSSGGIHHDGYIGNGTQFAMDDLRINENAVPEPATLLLLGSGLIVAACFRAFNHTA